MSEAAVEDNPGQGIDDLELLLEGGFFLGLLDQLLRQFPNLRPQDVEDALVEAATNTVQRVQKSPVGDVRRYLAKAAYNECNKAANKRSDLIPEGAEPTEQPSHEDAVLREMAVAVIKAEVRTWENTHIREVTLTFIEMYLAGEVLEAEEVADIVSANLGEEISAGSVYTWKARGFDRLRKFLETNEWYKRRPDRVEEETR